MALQQRQLGGLCEWVMALSRSKHSLLTMLRGIYVVIKYHSGGNGLPYQMDRQNLTVHSSLSSKPYGGITMSPHTTDREAVFKSLPGGRRNIMRKSGLRSFEVPLILRWLQRRCLAHSTSRGFWEPAAIPIGVTICWTHSLLHLGHCPSCRSRRLTSR